jgi:membrane protein YdbS with pleckstrin-like domain
MVAVVGLYLLIGFVGLLVIVHIVRSSIWMNDIHDHILYIEDTVGTDLGEDDA